MLAKVFYGWVQARNEGSGEVDEVQPKKEAKVDKGSALKQDRVSSLRQMLQERERERRAQEQREKEVLGRGVQTREREKAEQERLEKIKKAKAEEQRKLELQRAAQAKKEEQIVKQKKVSPLCCLHYAHVTNYQEHYIGFIHKHNTKSLLLCFNRNENS